MSERRTTPRYPVDLPVRFWSEPVEGPIGIDSIGHIADVSWGGLFLRSQTVEAVGTPVSLLVTMSQRDRPVPLRGHVAWICPTTSPKGPGMGIRLITPL